MDLKDYVIASIDSAEYYADLFPTWNKTSKPNVPCVFHPDGKVASLAVNLAGGGARCHAASCTKRIGNIVHFESTRRNIPELQAAEELYDRYVRHVVPAERLAFFQNSIRLPAARKMLQLMESDHGLTTNVTSQFGVGFNPDHGRLVFPIQNAYGLVVNLRHYKPRNLRRPGEPTLYNYVELKGTPAERKYGGNELFAWQMLSSFSTAHPLFFMASEKEVMLAHQLGLQAVASTAGEGSWMDSWGAVLAGFRVGILMDPDKGGRAATERLLVKMGSSNIMARPLALPFPRGYRGPSDFDDWIVRGGGDAGSLLALFEKSNERRSDPSGASVPSTLRRVLSPGRADPSNVSAEHERIEVRSTDGPIAPGAYEGEKLSVDELRRTPEAFNRIVTSQALVAGVAHRSFTVPWKFKIKPRRGTPSIFTVSVGRELLGFIGAKDATINDAVLGMCGANPKTNSVEALEYHPVTELELIPLAASAVENGSDSRYTVQRCFAFNIQPQANIAYEFRLVPTTMPQTQECVCVILEAKEVDRQEDFQLTPEVIQRFDKFRSVSEKENTGVAVWKKLEQLMLELSEHHTHIYERSDWHMVVLLTYFSPLQYVWPIDNKLQRGWLNTLGVGDTRTGKSEVVDVTSQILHAGEKVSSENCTYVGLVGGAIKGAAGTFMLRWGRIPLCDRKLLVLEELSGLTVEEISNMSDLRSSGIARLDKGGLAGQTPARTRLLCLSNVRHKTKRLADFLSGVEAVQQLVGHAEDLSRFDLVCTLVDDEVSAEVINRVSSRRTTRPTWALGDLRLLCQWVWSLQSSQISISPDAAKRCLELTLELGHDYHSGIPLFKASSDRHKIARIACAIACLQFSYDGRQVVVHPSHMDAAAQLLRALYDKPSLGYRERSRQMFDRQDIRDVAELNEVFRQVQPNTRLRTRAAEVLIHSARFSADELSATIGVTITQANLFIGTMLGCRAIRKGEANVWEVTQAGKKWLLTLSQNVTSHFQEEKKLKRKISTPTELPSSEDDEELNTMFRNARNY